MSRIRFALASGVSVEDLGSEMLVVIPEGSQALRLDGDASAVVRQIVAGLPVGLENQLTVSHLVDAGVVVRSGISRRSMLRTGAVAAGAGVAVLALPSVAAASSGGGGARGTVGTGSWTKNGSTYEFEVPFTPAGYDPNSSPMYVNLPDLSDLSVASWGTVQRFNANQVRLVLQWQGAGPGTDPANSVTGTFSVAGVSYTATFNVVP